MFSIDFTACFVFFCFSDKSWHACRYPEYSWSRVRMSGKGNTWGDFTSLKTCEDSDVYICGIQTCIERNQGSGDDSALNGVRFACCRMRLVKWEHKVYTCVNSCHKNLRAWVQQIRSDVIGHIFLRAPVFGLSGSELLKFNCKYTACILKLGKLFRFKENFLRKNCFLNPPCNHRRLIIMSLLPGLWIWC